MASTTKPDDNATQPPANGHADSALETQGKVAAPSNLKDRSLAIDENPYLTHDGAVSGKKKKRQLPAFLNHFNAKDLKTLFKCSVAVWIATLFFLIDPVLRTYGQATFFGCLILFFVPCEGIVLVQLLGSLTALIGMGLGWAWGVITMKAALAARPAAETNARLALLAQEARRFTTNNVQTSGQGTYTQVLVYNGFMLDTRITLVYFCMILTFIYFIARLRAKVPKLALVAVFGWIVVDIFLVIGPLLPTFQGTIAQVLVKPAATAVGLGLVCNILIFPRSTSYIVLDHLQNLYQPMQGFFHAFSVSLKLEDADFDYNHLQKAKQLVIAANKNIEAALGFLAIDVSISHWSAQDISGLGRDVRRTVVLFMDLLHFESYRVKFRQRVKANTHLGEHNEKIIDLPQEALNGNTLLARVCKALEDPEAEGSLHTIMDILLDSGLKELLDGCEEAVGALTEAFYQVNERKWSNWRSLGDYKQIKRNHLAVLERLRAAHKKCLDNKPARLLDSHAHLFNEQGELRHDDASFTPVHGLFMALIFEERILGISSALADLLTKVTHLETHRTRSWLWFPAGLHKSAAWLFGHDEIPRGGGSETAYGNESADLTKVDSYIDHRKKQNPAGPDHAQLEAVRYRPGTRRNPVARLALGFGEWLLNDEGMFALRVVVATIATAVPAVTTTTAGFFYREKGLWALIMAQTGLVTYTADFVFGFISRMIGTVIGGVLGLVCWYIGAGSGPGNPYGLAAIMAPVILLLMYARLWGGMALLQAVLLTAATTYLVVAYSYVDTHIPSYGNPGVGYSVFWRRLVLVIIGFGTSAIVMLIPKPPSASRRYRAQMAGTLASAKDLYVFWKRTASAAESAPSKDTKAESSNPEKASESSPDRAEDDDESQPGAHPKLEDLGAITGREVLRNLETLSAIAGPLRLLDLELSSTNFSAATLGKVLALCIDMNLAVAQLLHCYGTAPADLRARFVALTGALDADVLGDLMAVLTLVEHALKSGDALPAALPGPLMATSLKVANIAHAEQQPGGLGPLTREIINERGFRRYCVMLAAYTQLLTAADALVVVVKEVVGETHLIMV